MALLSVDARSSCDQQAAGNGAGYRGGIGGYLEKFTTAEWLLMILLQVVWRSLAAERLY